MPGTCRAGAGPSTHDMSPTGTKNSELAIVWRFVEGQQKGIKVMTISVAHLQPIVALIAGILILVIPRLLNIIVAVYLILVGLLGIGLFH